jgi:hypothetical protein
VIGQSVIRYPERRQTYGWVDESRIDELPNNKLTQ